MCGINGLLTKENCNDLENRIIKMNKSIEHRGPDASNHFIIKNRAAFGHLRLSIIDLSSKANQPFFSNDNRFFVLFNGEIYNYLILRKLCNRKFKSTSDTEVIVNYIDEYGLDSFLSKANGMFSIAVYFIEEDRLFLVRDRLGIKPLYYYLDDEKFIFSSEIKGILNSGLVDFGLNTNSLYDYLVYRYPLEPNTFFQKIYSLKAAHILEIVENRIISYDRYWELPDICRSLEKDNLGITNNVKKGLQRALEYRLVSDVPLGTYLSGGLDSSLLTVMAKRKIPNLKSYSAGLTESNEFNYSNQVAKDFEIQNIEVKMDYREYLDSIDYVIGFKDAPLSVPNEILLSKMSLELKKNITVVISGEGADELFAGYGKIFRSEFEYSRLKDKPNFEDFFMNKYSYFSKDVIEKCLITDINYVREIETVMSELFKNDIQNGLFRFFSKYHLKGLLSRLDTTTMLASVEARVPFVDHELIEYVYSNVSFDNKIKWLDKDFVIKNSLSINDYSEIYDEPKHILRIIAKDFLPDYIINRKKVGFKVPLEIMEGDLVDALKLDWGYIKNYFKCDVFELLQELEKTSSRVLNVWMLLNLSRFLKMYDKNWRY